MTTGSLCPSRQVSAVTGQQRTKGFPQVKWGENERGLKLALGKDQFGESGAGGTKGAEDPLRSLPEKTGRQLCSHREDTDVVGSAMAGTSQSGRLGEGGQFEETVGDELGVVLKGGWLVLGF